MWENILTLAVYINGMLGNRAFIVWGVKMGKKRFFSLAFSIAFLIGLFSVISIGHVESISSQRDDKHGNIWGGRKSPSGVISPMDADAEGFRRCLTHAEYENSGGLCSTMPNNTAYTSDYCVVYWIYAHNSKLGDKYIWKYYRPDGQLYSVGVCLLSAVGPKCVNVKQWPDVDGLACVSVLGLYYKELALRGRVAS